MSLLMSSSISIFFSSSLTEEETSFKISSRLGVSSTRVPNTFRRSRLLIKSSHNLSIRGGVPPSQKSVHSFSRLIKRSRGFPFRRAFQDRLPSGKADRADDNSKPGDLRRGLESRNAVFSLSQPEMKAFQIILGSSPINVSATVPLT